jgi:hypothetical protein
MTSFQPHFDTRWYRGDFPWVKGCRAVPNWVRITHDETKKKGYLLKLEPFTAGKMQMLVVWGVTPSVLVGGPSALKMVAACSSVTSGFAHNAALMTSDSSR